MANLRVNKIYGTSGPDANGSAVFNGTDYLTAANAAAFRLNQGSGADFTIEAWVYAKSVGTQFTIASLYHTTGNKRSYNLYVNTDGELKFNYSGNGTAGNTSVLNAGLFPSNELNRLYVDTKNKYSVIGSQFITYVFDKAIQEKNKSIYLGVYTDNTIAINFYRKHGFKKIGEYNYFVGPHIDREHIMQKIL